MKRTMALLLLALLAEGVMQTCRIPLFPLFIPFFASIVLPWWAWLGYGGVGIALAAGISGPDAIGFYLCCTLAAAGTLRVERVRFALFASTALLLWGGVSLLRHQVPVSAYAFDVFFSAVFARGLPDWAAATASRTLLISIAGLGTLVPLLRKRSTVLMAGLFASSCTTQPEAGVPFEAAEKGSITFDEGVTPEPTHPVLATRTRDMCLSCHVDRDQPTELPVSEKGIHEIHFVELQLALECTFCHQHAGEKGFPDLTGTGDGRTDYNQRCVTCHGRSEGGHSALRWEERFR